MDTKNLLSATWVVVTLIYLYDDVLRICSGDLAKSMGNMSFNQGIWLGIAILMLIPIWNHDLVCLEVELAHGAAWRHFFCHQSPHRSHHVVMRHHHVERYPIAR